MKPAIELNNLTKIYNENVLAVNKLTFHVKKGSILGFIGPNGAGKTTTIRMLTGLLKATAGTATVNGFDTHTELSMVKESIGYLPQEFGLYPFMQVGEYLEFVSKFYDLPNDRKTSCQHALETVRLTHLARRRVKALSTGEKQRLGIAQAILHDPDILFLDEPTSSLDPIGRQEVYQVLARLIKKRKTIFISSHILAELIKVVTDVVIIKNGELLFSGPVNELLKKNKRQYSQFRLRFEVLTEDLFDHIKAASWTQQLTQYSDNGLLVEANDATKAQIELIKLIADSQSILTQFISIDEDLEEVIIRLIS